METVVINNMKEKDLIKEGEFLFYQIGNSNTKIQVIVNDDTVWVTQKAMAEIFDVERSVITKHLKNIFESNELQEVSVCAKIAHTASDGKKYQTNFYNLDAIISVGYRVNLVKILVYKKNRK